MTRLKKFRLIFLVVVALLFWPDQLWANFDQIDQIILVLWHGLELEQIMDFELPKVTTWALLNTRAAGGDSLTASYLSLGAGARVAGWPKAGSFAQSEEDLQLYYFHTAQKPSSIVQVQIAQILQAQQLNYNFVIGALGEAFREAGLQIKVLGTSDTEERTNWAAVVAMDHLGRVYSGKIDQSILVADPLYPYGVKTNYDLLIQELKTAHEPLVVVDLGDPYRFDRYQARLLPKERDQISARVFTSAHVFVEELINLAKPHTVVLILSPHPSQNHGSGLHLTPIFATGLPAGLLSSSTTRWPGLITNMDLAPTILELLQIEHSQTFIGRSAEVVADEKPQIFVAMLARKIASVSQGRSVVLQVLITGQILLYSAILGVLFLPRNFSPLFLGLCQNLLLLFLLLPLILLLLPQFSWFVLVGVVIVLVLLKSLIPAKRVGVIAFLTSLALISDLLCASRLMRFSYLGYDAIGGARFYGIGNEYMGILVGSTILAWSVFCQYYPLKPQVRSCLGLLAFVFVAAFIGAPSLGTNVGGVITAVFGFGSTWLSFNDKKPNWKSCLGLILSVLLVLAILLSIDHRNPSQRQSHIGQTLELFRRDGFQALWLIIVRKLAVNSKLLRYSIWSKGLLGALVVLGVSYIWPAKFIFELKKTYPLIIRGVGGVVLGSVAAFVFNDSGVVAAATCLYFAVTTVLLLALELKHNFNSAQTNIEDNGNSH